MFGEWDTSMLAKLLERSNYAVSVLFWNMQITRLPNFGAALEE